MQETETGSVIDLVNHFSTDNIKVKDLSFRYNEKGAEYVLKNLNFEIKKGEQIGIVGRNGTGKTTLVKLFLKLYPDYKGQIFFDNHELHELNPAILRNKVFLFPQDIYIYNGTIKENILYGNLAASDDDIIRAAKLAGLHDFIKSQYLGYNQKVGDEGSDLSGGQKLKIGFARLFLTKADIIILDEAGSMLDVEAEKFIMQNVRAHFKGKTIITIAHRMHTLRNADRILVIDDGEIVEQGNHNELMKQEGLYHKFITTYIDY
jgi:ATP-binding cassette subfamily B protein